MLCGKVKNHLRPWNILLRFFVGGFLPEGLSGTEGGILDVIKEEDVIDVEVVEVEVEVFIIHIVKPQVLCLNV